VTWEPRRIELAVELTLLVIQPGGNFGLQGSSPSER
jgi:hypothetical protein